MAQADRGHANLPVLGERVRQVLALYHRFGLEHLQLMDAHMHNQVPQGRKNERARARTQKQGPQGRKNEYAEGQRTESENSQREG